MDSSDHTATSFQTNETHPPEAFPPAYERDRKELVDFRERVMANTIQVDTVYMRRIQKGDFTKLELPTMMKAVRSHFPRREWND
jgi:hypothetical protein